MSSSKLVVVRVRVSSEDGEGDGNTAANLQRREGGSQFLDAGILLRISVPFLSTHRPSSIENSS